MKKLSLDNNQKNQNKKSEIQQLKLLFVKESKLNKDRFEQIDRRFEQIDRRMEEHDKKFEQHDKMFEQSNDRLLTYLDKIFGAIQDLRAENSASTYLFDEQKKVLKDHEERISLLEEKIT
jgi:hypothetical protein